MNVNSHTFEVNSPPKTNLSSKIRDNELLPDLKSEYKSKIDFNFYSSKSSSNFLTSSHACGTYLSIIENLKTIEQAINF